MRVNSVYYYEQSKNSLFKTASFGAKNGGESGSGEKEGGSIFMPSASDRKEQAIKGLRKQIEQIRENGELDDKVKKAKIESLMEQIEEIEQEENKRKLEELANKLAPDNEQSAAQRKKKAEKEAEEKGSNLTITQEGMESLIKADGKLTQLQDMKVLKAKKEAEAVRVRQELEFDAQFGGFEITGHTAVRHKPAAEDYDIGIDTDSNRKKGRLADLYSAISNIGEAIEQSIAEINEEASDITTAEGVAEKTPEAADGEQITENEENSEDNEAKTPDENN